MKCPPSKGAEIVFVSTGAFPAETGVTREAWAQDLMVLLSCGQSTFCTAVRHLSGEVVVSTRGSGLG